MSFVDKIIGVFVNPDKMCDLRIIQPYNHLLNLFSPNNMEVKTRIS